LIDLKSIAFKCINYIKKGKSCEDVSLKLSLLINLLLTFGKVLVRFYRLLYKLEFAAACFTEDYAFQKDINIT
tara:strand:+ start:198 stop:416 length:219 start_codon:yes stop_codon:yes gene_type:complete